MQPFTLETERLVLDELRESDAQSMHEYCQDPEFERYLTIPWPYTLADARWFITEHAPAGWRDGSDLIWAVRRNDGSGTLLGVVGLRDKFGQYDIGFWLGRPHRGTGIVPEAINAVLDWAFGSSHEGLTSVSWECLVGNEASMIVARKLGFTFTGTRPSTLPARGGSHPPSWHGLLRASDDRSVKPGWPRSPAVGTAATRDAAVDSADAQNEGQGAP
ncbi:MAG: GNAT family protein [Homoserinimonas sp.]